MIFSYDIHIMFEIYTGMETDSFAIIPMVNIVTAECVKCGTKGFAIVLGWMFFWISFDFGICSNDEEKSDNES